MSRGLWPEPVLAQMHKPVRGWASSSEEYKQQALEGWCRSRRGVAEQ
jgi:hypothetical protein